MRERSGGKESDEDGSPLDFALRELQLQRERADRLLSCLLAFPEVLTKQV